MIKKRENLQKLPKDPRKIQFLFLNERKTHFAFFEDLLVIFQRINGNIRFHFTKKCAKKLSKDPPKSRFS